MLSFPKQFIACGPDMTQLRFPSLDWDFAVLLSLPQLLPVPWLCPMFFSN